ncbi:alpha/beta hydrolase [Rhodococcus sp. 06-621-2]|nr:alpha/beta hydrolase [Rhodococcus sp. 06-621-2]
MPHVDTSSGPIHYTDSVGVRQFSAATRPTGGDTLPIPRRHDAVPEASCNTLRATRQTYVGGLSKSGIPDEVLDDWFAPASRSREIRRDLRKFCTGTPPRTTLLEWAARLASFPRPVLVVWATEDRMMPLEHAHRLENLFHDSRRVLIDNSWTLIPEDQPEKFAAAIREFVSLAGR